MNIKLITTIEYNQTFSRAYKKLSLKEKILAEKREKIFRQNAFDPKLKTHKLKGKLKDYWLFSITYSHRILFKFTIKGKVLFYDIGDHDIYQ
ncbi:MAG: hypothetical protein ACD_58C00147G0007 [uncultured bacterium]|nr:MAG: hypothetical protein ACD_58C00147G0007 [uncultured bacterium]